MRGNKHQHYITAKCKKKTTLVYWASLSHLLLTCLVVLSLLCLNSDNVWSVMSSEHFINDSMLAATWKTKFPDAFAAAMLASWSLNGSYWDFPSNSDSLQSCWSFSKLLDFLVEASSFTGVPREGMSNWDCSEINDFTSMLDVVTLYSLKTNENFASAAVHPTGWASVDLHVTS